MAACALAGIAALGLIACGRAGGDTAAGDAADAARLVALGRAVFFEPALSADGRVSCATCHRPELVYSDGQARAAGTGGQRGTRNAPSLVDVGRQRSLFWDGRRTRLEDQALDPLLNPVEHGLGNRADLLARLRAQPRLAAAFLAAYGIPASQATPAHVAGALAAFERTLVPSPSPFDRFLAGQRDAIPEAARLGWITFDQQAHCTRCHVVATGDAGPPVFTDHQFHRLSVGFARIERKLPELAGRLAALHRDGRPLGPAELGDPDIAELGRFAVTLDPRDVAAFKTPSLRNVAATAPYMHDGSVATLAEAVDLEIYSRGGNGPGDVPLIPPAERANLVAFLASLTGQADATDATAARAPR